MVTIVTMCTCAGTLYSEGRVTDVVDKKSGALILVDGEEGGREGGEKRKRGGWVERESMCNSLKCLSMYNIP